MNMMNIRPFLQRIARMIHPPLPIGGLEISDTFLRFVAFHGLHATTIAVRLPPGVLDNGMVINRDALLFGLRDLYRQMLASNEPPHVVVTIASSHVYTQVVRLPAIPVDQYASALDLTLRANSPLDATHAYYDAELLGFGSGSEREFLAAFVDRTFIDSMHDALTEVGFSVVAIEFPALSIARVVATLGRGYVTQQPLLLLVVVPDGVDFMIVRDGHLLFHYWNSFRSLHDMGDARSITAAAFQSAMSGALQRTLNFYTSQWGGAIRDVVITTSGAAGTLHPLLERFGLRVLPLSVERFADVVSSWPAALGAALRGLVPRNDDVFISIAPLGTEASLLREQFWHAVAVWRSVVVVATVGVFLLFLISDAFFVRQQAQDAAVVLPDGQSAAFRDATKLRDQAIVFNQSVDLVASAFAERSAASSLLINLRRLAGGGIVLRHLALQSRDRSVALTGHAASGFAAIDFKNTLVRQPQFENVILPFARMTPEDSGISFQLSLQLAQTPPQAF